MATALHSSTIHRDICSMVGNTPTFRLPRLSQAAGAEFFGKAEHLNPGGSIKDRVALAMVQAAEAQGLEPGTTLVEATAGNTGIGLAWIAAARGYPFIAVMSDSDRGPKTETMAAMGTEVVLASHDAPWDSDAGPLGIAARLAAERGGVFLNQFENPANPNVHETTTAVEILDTFGDDLDAVIVGVGTGGTATGLSRGLKSRRPDLKVIGVSAEGSYLGSEKPGDRIAGITPDFEAKVFDPQILDRITTVTSEEAAVAARRLAETEGLPVGHSSGAFLLVAEEEARQHPGSRILIFLCDSVRNYPTLMQPSS